MKIHLFLNKDKTQSFEPDAFVRLKIGEEWKDLGTATAGLTAKGTPYYEMEVSEEVIVEKLREIDWKPKSAQVGEFVTEVVNEELKREYPQYYGEEGEGEDEDLFTSI